MINKMKRCHEMKQIGRSRRQGGTEEQPRSLQEAPGPPRKHPGNPQDHPQGGRKWAMGSLMGLRSEIIWK